MTRKVRRYVGEAITVTFEPKRCIHAEACVRGLPQVFDRDGRPWINPNGASAEEIAALVGKCPTGALQVEHSEGARPETATGQNVVTVSQDGPLFMQGRLQIQTSDSEEPIAETRAALCRCGESSNKPFCDNEHVDCGFVDAGDVIPPRNAVEELPPRGAVLEITTSPDGPVLVKGPLEIRGADGSTCALVTKAAFCRCGHSKEKPFCDGTHRTVGFQS